jgi:hypothetical protein
VFELRGAVGGRRKWRQGEKERESEIFILFNI